MKGKMVMQLLKRMTFDMPSLLAVQGNGGHFSLRGAVTLTEESSPEQRSSLLLEVDNNHLWANLIGCKGDAGKVNLNLHSLQSCERGLTQRMDSEELTSQLEKEEEVTLQVNGIHGK